jgi:hypothetical protein
VAGKAKVEVVPWRGSHWVFDVGPFLITVKGTAFTAEWKDTEERLEVVLKTGTVAVSGPLSDEAITLRAGQRLIISMRDKEVVIRDADATGEIGDATSVPPRPSTEDVDGPPSLHVDAPPPATPAPRAAAPIARAPTKTASRTTSWTAELAAGHFASILRQAEQRGLERSLEDASMPPVTAIEKTLLAARSRHRGAAFLPRRAPTTRRFFWGGSRKLHCIWISPLRGTSAASVSQRAERTRRKH